MGTTAEGVREATDAEVLDAVGRFAGRLARELELPPATAERVRELLLGEDAARDLLAAAFLEGREDKARELVLRGGATLRPAPDWSDVPSRGERVVVVREESACSSCGHAPVCALRRAFADELVVISRCSFYAEGAPVRAPRPMR